MKTNNTIINSIMKNYIKYICALLLLGLSTSTWGATITLTYNYNSDYNDMWWGDMEDASSYWKITGTALFSVPISVQPTSNITITINMAYFGNGTEGLERVSATGTESSSNWTLGETASPTSHTGKTYQNEVYTITKPGSPTTLEGLDITIDNNYGKALRIASITISYTGTPTYNVYLMSGCTGGSYSSNKGTSGSGTGSYSGCTKYSGISSGTSVTITAAPTSGYQFDGWTDGGYSIIFDDSSNEITPSSTTSTTATFTMPSSDVVIWKCNFSVACTSRTITMSNFSKDYGATDFVPTHTVYAGSGTKTWTSSNTSVATIVDGKVHIVSAGSTTITLNVAAAGGYCEVSKSCTMTVNAVAPTVSDFTVTSYTNNKITVSNANASQITNKGGANITRYGYIYSTTASTTSTLTFGASGVSDANVGTSNIALNTKYAAKDITGLSAGTTYYVRAYAYNGSAYGYSSAICTVTTKCAVTYVANGGTGSTTDASSPYEKLSDVTVLANGFTPPAGKKFVDWLGSDANHYAPGDVINDISTDMTLTAQWTDITYEKYVFACVDISVASAAAGKALVTSRYEAAKNINVMATNPIKVTVSGAVAGHRVTFTNSVGLHFYKKVEGTGDDVGKYKYIEATGANSFVTPLTNQEVYVSYQPTSAGTGAVLSELPFTISCDGESQEFNTAGEYIKARNLPSSVAIVANVGGSWHGLSANITSSSTPKDKMIAVATDGGILKAYGPSDDFGYKLWPVRTVNSSYDRSGYTYSSGYPAKLYGDRLRFAGKDNKGLMANNNESSNKYNINNYGAITVITAYFEHDENYEWKVTTREENGQFVYTLQSDQTNNNRYLRLWNDRWGTYLDERGTEDVYILPLVETALVDMSPFEWGTDQVVVSYTPGATPVALTGVNMGSDAAASPTFTQLGTSDLWRVSGLTGMTDKPAQQLQVKITENGTAKQGLLQIPLIVDGTSTEAELRSSLPGANADARNKVAKNTDVVILSGGKMTTNTASGNFKDLYIYAGGKAIITNAMSFGDIYMRGGFGYIGDETWDVARAKIDAAVSLGDEGKLYYDLTIDGTKYYDLAVPYEVDLTATTDDKGDGDFNVWMKVYDGTLRANTGKGWTWYDWNGDLLLHPGTGYLIEATPRYNRSYCTIRFPMSPDLSSGEAEKDPFAVTAPGMNADDSIATGKVPNNVGWNFIANPYMCNFGTDDMSEGKDGTLKLGQLVEHRPDGVWDGTYEWDTEGEKNIRYVTTFDYNTQHYEQHPLSSTVLDPFTGFFVQIAKAGSLNFTSEGRQLSAPAIMLASQLPNDMELVLTVSGNGYSDETRLHINNELSLADAMEFPDEMTKQLNAGVINFYTIANGINMYANGMSYEDAQEWIPAGVVAPQEGLYAFSVSGVNANYIKSVLLLDKNSGYEYDLMSVNPQLFLNNGTDDERFAVKIVLREEDETPTGLFDVQTDNTRAIKFIYRDNMYILLNGNVYDATGKRVKEINK